MRKANNMEIYFGDQERRITQQVHIGAAIGWQQPRTDEESLQGPPGEIV